MADANFDLTKWQSNDAELRNYISGTNSPQTERKSIRKILGLNWDFMNDQFIFEFNDIVEQSKTLKHTKRNILKLSAMFFDPLGLISPITLQSKLIFKQLCIEKLEWDVIIPKDILSKWMNLIDELRLTNININRHLYITEKESIVELHGFCDASFQAISATRNYKPCTVSDPI